jgi:hypothetical protein
MMYPNQPPEQPSAPQPPQPYILPPVQEPENSGASYLDSIAAPPKQNTLSSFALWGIIGGIIFTLVITVIFIFNSGSPSRAETFTNYVHRVQALSRLTSSSTKIIQNSELRALNATTVSVLGTANQESSDVLKAVDIKKLPANNAKSPIAAEFSELNTKLDNARLNVAYDRVYAREIGYHLAKIRAQINTLHKSSKNKKLRAYLEKTDANLQPLVSQYNQFNNSQG